MENELTDDLSIVNELLYQNSSMKVTIYTAIEGVLDQKVTMQFISLPVLLKYKTSLLGSSYFLLGPSFSYMIKAKYNFYDEIYEDHGNVEITREFPGLCASIEFGFGKEIKISDMDLLTELRLHLGLTRFKDEHRTDHYDIGTWNNSGIELLIGIPL